MEWAATLFPIENRTEPSEFIERIWRTKSVPEKEMISVAVPNWQMVIVRHPGGRADVLVRGPEAKATVVEIPRDAEFVGIEFKLGTFIPSLAMETLVGVGKQLNAASPGRVHIGGSNWELPSFENAQDFVKHIASDGVLVRDTAVEEALLRQPLAISERSLQRRFLRAVGLTYGTVRQIERAERTAALLAAGTSILDAVDIANYSDQAHLTRSFTRFLGKTPGSLVRRKR